MKKILLTSLVAMGVATAASAGAINDNPLYLPTAGTFYSVTDLVTDTAFEGAGLGTQFGYGITNKLAVYVGTSVALYDEFNEFAWSSVDLGAAFRALDMGNWKADIVGNLTVLGNNFYDKDANLYTWSAGVRGGYVTRDWTLAGSVVYGYTNTEAFNWGDEGLRSLALGLSGQYLIDNNWNVVAGLTYDILSITDGVPTDADTLTGKLGVNYNFTDDMYLGGYVTYEFLQDGDKDVGLGVRFGVQF